MVDRAAPKLSEPAHKAQSAPSASDTVASEGVLVLDDVVVSSAAAGIAPTGSAVARHAAVLRDVRVQGMGAGQRAQLMRQIQRSSGNGHVERVLAQVRETTATDRSTPIAPEEPTVQEQTPAASVSERSGDHQAPTNGGQSTIQRWDPFSAVKSMVSGAVLGKIADVAKYIPGYTLLTLVLGKDPISDKPVERNAANMFRAIVGFFPPLNLLLTPLEESGAIDTAFAWLDEQFGQLGLTWSAIKVLLGQAWDAITANPFEAKDKLVAIFAQPLARLKTFLVAAGDKLLEFIFEGVMSKLGGTQVLGMLKRAGGAFQQIIKDPIGFLSNMLNGVKQGFLNFGKNILTHLGKGVVTWLFGELDAGGIKLPKEFDLKGVLNLVTSVLGLTWANIRKQAVTNLGEETVARLESGAEAGFKLFTIINEQGLGGLWELIKEQLGNLKDMVLDGVKDLVTSQIVQAGIQMLITLLGGPAGALVKAIQTIYNVVMWFVNNAGRLAALINSIGESINAIANGAVGQAATFIEAALGNSVPVLLGMLANLLGLGNLSTKIKGVIEKIQAPIKKAMGWVLDKAKGFVGKVMGGVKKVGGKIKGALGIKDKPPELRLREGMALGVSAVNKLKGKPVVGEALLRPILNGIRGFKGLSVLEPFAKDGYWHVRGDVQRTKDTEQVTVVPVTGKGDGGRIYAPTLKHQPGRWGTTMDLDNVTAAKVLNEGIMGSNGKQVYGFHNGKVYEFQIDNVGSYHGYPIPGNEAPSNVLKAFLKAGTITNSQFNRLRKGK